MWVYVNVCGRLAVEREQRERASVQAWSWVLGGSWDTEGRNDASSFFGDWRLVIRSPVRQSCRAERAIDTRVEFY